MACHVVIEANPEYGPLPHHAQHLHLEGRPQDSRVARWFVAQQLVELPDELIYTAQLLTSELISNAVLHAGSPFVLGVSVSAHEVLITVADEERRRIPRPREAPDLEMLAESGRGFQIIASEADDFGWHTMPHDMGKVVWFTLAIRAGHAFGGTDAMERDVPSGGGLPPR